MPIPRFDFYPRDWISDTRGLTADEKAAYIDLLAFLWLSPEQCALTDDDRQIAMMLSLDVRKWRRIKARLTPNFVQTSNGLLSQQRLQKEYKSAQEVRSKRKSNLLKANKTRHVDAGEKTLQMRPHDYARARGNASASASKNESERSTEPLKSSRENVQTDSDVGTSDSVSTAQGDRRRQRVGARSDDARAQAALNGARLRRFADMPPQSDTQRAIEIARTRLTTDESTAFTVGLQNGDPEALALRDKLLNGDVREGSNRPRPDQPEQREIPTADRRPGNGHDQTQAFSGGETS